MMRPDRRLRTPWLAIALVLVACSGQVATPGPGTTTTASGASSTNWSQINLWVDAGTSSQENPWPDGGGPNPFNGGW